MRASLTVLGCTLALVSFAGAQQEVSEDNSTRFLQERVRLDPDDIAAWNRLGEAYLGQLTKSGKLELIESAAECAKASLAAVPAGENYGGLALQARVFQAGHRFEEAKKIGQQLTEMAPARPDSWRILGNACLEVGDYPGAAEAWEQMEKLEPVSYATQTCLARQNWVYGKVELARKNLVAAKALAADGPFPTPLEQAWCCLQLGKMDFAAGDFDAAEQQFLAAKNLAPDWYLVQDHLAELDAARGNYDSAIMAYQKLAEQLPRPEFFQAIGDLYVLKQQPDAAKEWFRKAIEAYLAGSETLFAHHLAGFYSDSQIEPAEAVKWAKIDMKNRQSLFAWDCLAWALWRGGDYQPALEAVRNAIRFNTRDPHLIYHAGMIFMSAGEVVEGKRLLSEALTLNPHYNTFHVHR